MSAVGLNLSSSKISIIGMIQHNNLKYPRFTSTSINSFIERIYKEIKKDFKYCEEIINKFDFKSLLAEGEIKGKMKKEQTDESLSAESRKKEDKKSDKDNIENIDDKNITEIMKDTADHLSDIYLIHAINPDSVVLLKGDDILTVFIGVVVHA